MSGIVSKGPSGREGALIAQLTSVVPTAALPHGPGDDCAVISEGPRRVLSTDALIEEVHFLRTHPPEWLGWKVLASNLSDIAGMGAIPEGFTLAAALPRATPDPWWGLFARGMAEYARKAGVLLVGGDIVASPGPLMFTVTCWGTLGGEAMLQRDAARPGHDVWFAGTLGRSRQGLQRWLALNTSRSGAWPTQPCPALWAQDPLLLAHLRPDPPLSVGPAALAAGATAGMDVSDGLWVDGQRLALASGVDVIIDLDSFPTDPALPHIDARQRVLGGEDYGLLMTAPPAASAGLAALGCTKIGRIIASHGESQLSMVRSGDKVEGFDREAPFQHFGSATDEST